MARVERIRDYLAAGDVYQVNLARRHVARIRAPGDALALYQALAGVAPAPYGGLIEADGVTIVSGSPERFLASVGDRVETRPIKGTRARTPGGAEDLATADKDGAEHLMIVDLERNDLGRIAETGSVRVDELGYVVELPALYHKVSRVRARPRAGIGYGSLLRATFPGGSITGAPKVRSMELIDELEPARRGPYCGAFGFFGGSGAFDLAIAIRIGVIVGSELRVHVGGGIVTDSDPAAELAETELKAKGWVAALAALDRSPGRSDQGI
jgi:anthranilate synthase component 1